MGQMPGPSYPFQWPSAPPEPPSRPPARDRGRLIWALALLTLAVIVAVALGLRLVT